MRSIVIDPYQIGHDNREALESGAFYFYRRLGFEPRATRLVRRLARAEDDRIRARPTYRSPRPSSGGSRPPSSASISPAVASRRGRASPRAGSRRSSRRTWRAGSRDDPRQRRAKPPGRWPLRSVRATGGAGRADERWGFALLAPAIALIPDLARWPAADRRRLLAAMRAKGGASEARYVRQLDGLDRLRRKLRDAAPAGTESDGGTATPREDAAAAGTAPLTVTGPRRESRRARSPRRDPARGAT